MKTRLISLVLVLLLLCGVASATAEVAWPTDTVTFYVPASAGGGTDVAARALSTGLTNITGKSFVVVNQTTGGGTVAYETVRNAKTDGSELLYFHPNLFIGYYTGVYKNSPIENFTPISVVSLSAGQAFVVKADSPYQSVDDLVAASKEKANVVRTGVQNGGFDQLIMQLFSIDAGIELRLVEAGSQPERITALLGGNIDFAAISVDAAIQYSESGDMRILGITAKEPDANYPDIPTVVSLGYENTHFDVGLFIMGPKDMDPELVKVMNETIAKAAEDDFVKQYAETSKANIVVYDVEKTNEYIKNLDASIKTVTESVK